MKEPKPFHSLTLGSCSFSVSDSRKKHTMTVLPDVYISLETLRVYRIYETVQRKHVEERVDCRWDWCGNLSSPEGTAGILHQEVCLPQILNNKLDKIGSDVLFAATH